MMAYVVPSICMCVRTRVCMYVRRPRAHHARACAYACAHIDTVKIVSIKCVLTRKLRSSPNKGTLRLKQIQRRLERKEVGGQYTRVVSFCSNKAMFIICISLIQALTQTVACLLLHQTLESRPLTVQCTGRQEILPYNQQLELNQPTETIVCTSMVKLASNPGSL